MAGADHDEMRARRMHLEEGFGTFARDGLGA